MSKTENTHRKLPAQWIDAFGPGLFRRALFLTSNRETAEDLVQDTFLSAAQQIDRFSGKSAPKTWLHAILKNKIADHFREQYRRQPFANPVDDPENDFFTPGGMWRPEAVPTSWDHASENLLDNPDFNRILDDCLKTLQPLWRDVVLSKYYSDKKGAEICQEFNVSPTNFWQILHRAKTRLRNCIEQHWLNA